MYISAISPFSQYKQSQKVKVHQDNLNVNLLSQSVCDEVCFTGGYAPTKFKKVLYRAIGQSELDALLKPEGYIFGQKYTTGNPMGWGARDWASGFKHGQENYYFVEFKPESFDFMHVMDASDYASDSRFVITRGYSLDDVKVIREGTNSHGKIVWAASEDVKIEDKASKISDIYKLLRQVSTAKYQELIDNAMVELSSYVKEFPQLIDALIPIAEKDSNFAYKLLYVISKSDNKSYYNFVKKYYTNFLKNPDSMKIHESSLYYVSRHGSNKDLDLLLNVMKKDKDVLYHSYGLPISKLMKQKDVPKILNELYSSSYGVQNSLLNAFMYRQDDQIALDVVRTLLHKYSSFDVKTFKQDSELKTLLATCTEVLSRSAEVSDIPLMQRYANLGIFTDVDFKAIIKDLEG